MSKAPRIERATPGEGGLLVAGPLPIVFGETHELLKFGKWQQLLGMGTAGQVAQSGLHCCYGAAEQCQRIGGDLEPQLLECWRPEQQRLTMLEHVGERWAPRGLAAGAHFFLALGRLEEDDVGPQLFEAMDARQR